MNPEPTPRSLIDDEAWRAERMEASRRDAFAPLWSEATS